MKGKAGNGKKLSRLFLLLAGLTLMYLYTIASAQPEQKSQAPTQEQSVTAVEAVSERHSALFLVLSPECGARKRENALIPFR